MKNLVIAVPVLNSPIARIDPRWRLLGLVVLALTTACMRTLAAATCVLVLAFVLAWLAGLTPGRIRDQLAPILLILAPVAILVPLSWADTPGSWSLGPISIVPERVRLVGLIFFKAIALLLLFNVLMVAAPLASTFKAAHAIGVPSVVLQVLMLSYRYIFLLAEELDRMRIALRIRGYRNRANRHSYRTVGHLAGVLFVRGYERGERVSQAMLCRGYTGRFPSLGSFCTRPVDVGFATLLVAFSLAMLALDWIGLHAGA